MAGRRPIRSARHLLVRTQISLRLTEADLAKKSAKMRLVDLIEQLRDEGVLSQYLVDALMEKMIREEGEPFLSHAPQHVDPTSVPMKAHDIAAEAIAAAQQRLMSPPVPAPNVIEPVSTFEQHDELAQVQRKPADAVIERAIAELNVAEGEATEIKVNPRPRGNLFSAMGKAGQ